MVPSGGTARSVEDVEVDVDPGAQFSAAPDDLLVEWQRRAVAAVALDDAVQPGLVAGTQVDQTGPARPELAQYGVDVLLQRGVEAQPGRQALLAR
jgi:hypothetical protein